MLSKFKVNIGKLLRFQACQFLGGTFSPTHFLQFFKSFKIVAYLSESNENTKKKREENIENLYPENSTFEYSFVHGFDVYIKITSICLIFLLVWYCRIDQND